MNQQAAAIPSITLEAEQIEMSLFGTNEIRPEVFGNEVQVSAKVYPERFAKAEVYEEDGVIVLTSRGFYGFALLELVAVSDGVKTKLQLPIEVLPVNINRL